MLAFSSGTAAGLAAFFGVALWETWRPRRALVDSLAGRWSANLLVYICGVYAAGWLIEACLGPAWQAMLPGLPPGPATLLLLPVGVLFLDFEGYWSHRLLHAVPALWRCHALHHSDREVDVSTSYRHHPFEPAIVSFMLPLSAMAIGIPGDIVIVYGVVDAIASVFHHGNVKLPARLERVLAPIIVTPDMHRIHHSVERSEADSNFGTVFSFWDRLFASYTAPVPEDRRRLVFGLAEFSSPSYQRLPLMMMIPFLRGARGA